MEDQEGRHDLRASCIFHGDRPRLHRVNLIAHHCTSARLPPRHRSMVTGQDMACGTSYIIRPANLWLAEPAAAKTVEKHASASRRPG
jgi:hypothetical protein